MPEYLAPGVYVEEVDTGSKPIEGVSTSTAGMIGVTERGPVNIPILITSYGEFRRWFGDALDPTLYGEHRFLPHAIQGFFNNGGKRVFLTRVLDPSIATAASRNLVAKDLLSPPATQLLRGAAPASTKVLALDGTGFDTKLDKNRLLKLKKYFNTVRPRYKEFLSNITGVETEIFDSQIPGGMISNMESQLKQQKAGDRVDEVLAEVPKVRAVSGYPPLVTPTSQIVGTQAVFNILMGPYKVLTGEFADLMLGYYGETIGPRDPAVIEQATKQTGKELITCRPADLLKPEWQDLRTAALAIPGCNGSDEDVLTCAMFPQVAPKFFSTRDQGPKNLSRDPNAQPPAAPAPVAQAAPQDSGKGPVQTKIAYDVKLNGKTHRVTVTPA